MTFLSWQRDAIFILTKRWPAEQTRLYPPPSFVQSPPLPPIEAARIFPPRQHQCTAVNCPKGYSAELYLQRNFGHQFIDFMDKDSNFILANHNSDFMLRNSAFWPVREDGIEDAFLHDSSLQHCILPLQITPPVSPFEVWSQNRILANWRGASLHPRLQMLDLTKVAKQTFTNASSHLVLQHHYKL